MTEEEEMAVAKFWSSIGSNTVAGFSSTDFCGHNAWETSITFFKDYQQLWHVVQPKNLTLRIRVFNRQYFLWVKRP
jgi:hypothetical protein